MSVRFLRGKQVMLMGVICLMLALLLGSGSAVGMAQGDEPALSDRVDFEGFDLVSENEGWLLVDQELYWTKDGGVSWEPITPSGLGESMIRAVFFVSSEEGGLILTDFDESGAISYAYARTFDGGKSWQSAPLSLFEASDVSSLAGAVYLHFIDAQTGWLVIKRATSSNFSVGSLFKTSDGGKNWTQVTIPIGEPVYFATSEVGWTAGGAASDELYRTEDGGRTWVPQTIKSPSARAFYQLPTFENPREGLLPVVVVDEDKTHVEFYATSDGGQSWELATSVPVDGEIAPGSSLPLSVLDARRWLMVAPNSERLLSILEGGESRSLVSQDGLLAGINELDMASAEVGWAKYLSGDCVPGEPSDGEGKGAAQCDLQIQLLRTEDGGKSWRELSLPHQESPPTGGSSSPPLTPPNTRGGTVGAQFKVPPLVLGGVRGGLEAGGSVQRLSNQTSIFTGQGFDKCEIATLNQLESWISNSPYGAVNLYIGGSSRFCANSALTATYLSQLSQQGWTFIPTWVGPQAPCTTYASRFSDDVTTAYYEGISQADAAIDVAINLGLGSANGSGTIIYYDLEAYDTTNSACRDAANSFISGWTAQLHARSNLSGVYGLGCAIREFATISNVPDAIWPAHWLYTSYNPDANVWDVLCLTNDQWTNHQRIRQYAGDHNETWGGVTLNIDSNAMDGIVATIRDTSTLLNRSFESSSNPVPWQWYGPCDYYAYNNSAIAYDGNRYLSANRDNNDTCSSFYQDITQAPAVGDTYNYAIWLRSSDGSARDGRIAIWALGGQPQTDQTDFSVSSTSWQCIETSLTIERSDHNGMRAEVYLESLDEIDYYFDYATFHRNGGTICPGAECYSLASASTPTAGGTISATPSPNCAGDEYQAGTAVTLTANATSGYTFSHWSGDASGSNNPISVSMDADKSVTAHFDPIPECYTLSSASVPSAGGTISATPSPNCAGDEYQTGTAVTLTANPTSGYTFSHWSGDASGSNNPISVSMDADKSVTANFTQVADNEPTISDVRITNVRDVSFTVSWLTDVEATGQVRYGTDPNNLNQSADDQRGAATSDDTHYVTLTGLDGNTTYYFDVVSGGTTDNNGGVHYTVTTGPTLALPSSETIYGQLFFTGTTPAEGTIVYIALQDGDGAGSSAQAAPLSALVNSNGEWSANLGNARTVDLSSYYSYSASGDTLSLQAEGAADGIACLIVDTGNDTPVPAMTLSASQCAMSWPISLESGWNHVSLPVQPLAPLRAEDLCEQIESQGGNALEIDRWYASGWEGHICGLSFNNFDILLGSSYFVRSASASTWSIQGQEVTNPVPLTLQIGWNSIAVPHTDAYSASSLCDEITSQGVSAVEIDRWYASGWQGHICGFTFNNFNIQRGVGYFVKATSAGTITLRQAQGTAPSTPASQQEPAEAPVLPHDIPAGAVMPVRDLVVSNLRDTSVTLSWTTDQPTTGYVLYSRGNPSRLPSGRGNPSRLPFGRGNPSRLPSQLALDLRGASHQKTHYVTLTGLEPETSYDLKVVSGAESDEGQPQDGQPQDGQPQDGQPQGIAPTVTITTAPTLESLPTSHTIYGRVYMADEVTPATDLLLYLTLQDADRAGDTANATLLSALVDENGYWHANLGNARLADGTLFDYSPNGDELLIEVEGAERLTQTLNIANLAPAPDIILTDATVPTSITVGALDSTSSHGSWLGFGLWALVMLAGTLLIRRRGRL